MESAKLMRRKCFPFLVFSLAAAWCSAQPSFQSLWGPAWHEGPWTSVQPIEGGNSTAHELLLGVHEGGLVLGRMNVQFDTEWWEQIAEWTPFVATRLDGPARFDHLEPMSGPGLRSPQWPGLGEVTHLAYDPTHTWAVMSAYSTERSTDVDLFLVTRTRDGWSSPQPMESLNTPYNEVFPNWIGGRLVFGSDRPGGAGGYDLYVADRLNSFRGAERLEAPVNSAGDDVAAMGSEQGWYVCSSRKGGNGGLDIWWLERPREEQPVERAAGWTVQLLNAQGASWLNAELELRGLGGAVLLRTAFTEERPEVTLDEVPLAQRLTAEVVAREEGEGVLEIRTPDGVLRMRLPVRTGEPFFLNLLALESIGASGWTLPEDESTLPEPFASVQVFFAANESELSSTARGELGRWWARWTEEGQIRIADRLLISGFADQSGTDDHNASLSRARAEAVSRWFQELGFQPDQLAIKALSNTEPLDPDRWDAIALTQPVYEAELPCERRVEVRWWSW